MAKRSAPPPTSVGTPVVISTHLNYKPDPHALAQLVRNGSGPIVHDLIRRADLVTTAAKRQVRRGHIRAGMQDMGGGARPNLADTIKKRIIVTPSHDPVAMVGSDLAPLALIHHNGSRPHTIVPRTASVLAFMSQSGGGMRFAMSVRHPGTRPNRYLTDNLHLAGG